MLEAEGMRVERINMVLRQPKPHDALKSNLGPVSLRGLMIVKQSLSSVAGHQRFGSNTLPIPGSLAIQRSTSHVTYGGERGCGL